MFMLLFPYCWTFILFFTNINHEALNSFFKIST